MKTKNNVQKTVFKSVATAIGLVIIGLTVNAQYSLKSMFEPMGSNPIAMVEAKTTNNWAASEFNTGSLVKTSSMAAYLVAESEEPLHLEEWMMSENRFNVNENKTEPVVIKEANKTISTATFVYVEVNEERALKVEEWMTDPKVWGR